MMGKKNISTDRPMNNFVGLIGKSYGAIGLSVVQVVWPEVQRLGRPSKLYTIPPAARWLPVSLRKNRGEGEAPNMGCVSLGDRTSRKPDPTPSLPFSPLHPDPPSTSALPSLPPNPEMPGDKSVAPSNFAAQALIGDLGTSSSPAHMTPRLYAHVSFMKSASTRDLLVGSAEYVFGER
ncbi:hypothetical protein DEU56DRAFT_832266 [Suillus clintonianus]|uniref:uncharacterized protein n=1 Tax=Suillus clintonianus TaxID=1904413 RepID=UPI001B87CCB0|nr:uncharacterized protein DEU56DRAFT_832266 [Suillus clintonianus]KAG2122336.1 hypothetical protein DEU56DRAFT_832266 [Suillus clintonianus]